MYFRELYFSATPIKQLTLEFGSLGIERGAGTEATTYDDDGYISGERLRIHDSAHLYADEISFTSAYEGDILQPNFFNRAERLGQSNYRQIMAEKHFGSRLNTSADYTFDKGTHTIREAAHLKVPELKAIDGIRVELYQRVNNYLLEGQTFYAHQGAAVTLSRTIRKSFQIEGGYADVDPDYGVLTGSRVMAAVGFSMNGDAYLTGQRLFTRANWKVTPYISLFGYYTHELVVPLDYLQVNKQSLNYGATIDFKNILTKLHVL
jgi:hypothetical protein